MRILSCYLLLLLAGGLLARPAMAQRRRPAAQSTKMAHKASAARPARRRAAPRRARAARPRSKAQLERERQANLSRIAEAGQVLTQTTRKKQATLGQLNAISEKLTRKQGQIQHLSTQLTGLETSVHQTAREVLSTTEQLARLKQEYGQLMYTASKTSSGYNQLMFLFAAESFNQFVQRLRYVHQYTEQRQRQAVRILGAQQQLGRQLDGLTRQRQRQQQLLRSQLAENQNLLGLKTQQAEVVQQLSQQEQSLRQELAERQRAVARLDELIAQRVRDEIARTARAARLARTTQRRRAGQPATAQRRRKGRPQPNSEGPDPKEGASPASNKQPGPPEGANQTANEDYPSTNPESDSPEETRADRRASRVVLTPETAAVSSNFADNRGRLPWPVVHGFLAQRFGRHPHPVLRHVTVENRGIDIQTNEGEVVRAVAAGQVLTVAQVPGMNTIVMIQHGEYFTVYAKLYGVSVHEGQQVEARDPIGTAATAADGTTEVQFQVWRNSANLNPESWLGRR